MTDQHVHTELHGPHSGVDSHPVVHGDHAVHDFFTPEMYTLSTAIAIYSKAFVEALAKRHADGLADLLRTRPSKNGENDEAEIGLDDGTSATIAITVDTPDEARLALLDLDVTSEELRGKLLHWDSAASAWRPANTE